MLSRVAVDDVVLVRAGAHYSILRGSGGSRAYRRPGDPTDPMPRKLGLAVARALGVSHKVAVWLVDEAPAVLVATYR